MRIKTFGWRNKNLDQISRIEEGLLSLEHQITSDDPEIIYCNDSTVYSEGESLKNLYPNSKLIFNVLDIPPHCLDYGKFNLSKYAYIHNPYGRTFNINELKHNLSKADIVTCICEEVRSQVKDFCNIDSFVIHNPVRDIDFIKLNDSQKVQNSRGVKYKYLYVGRIDSNKRFEIVKNVLKTLNEPQDLLAVAGPDNPNFGDFYSVLGNEHLNLLYNSVDYLFLPAAFKSIGLPALEAVISHCVPIVCDDDPCTAEFFKDIGLSSDPTQIAKAILDKDWNEHAKKWVTEQSSKYKKQMDKKQIAQNILNLL